MKIVKSYWITDNDTAFVMAVRRYGLCNIQKETGVHTSHLCKWFKKAVGMGEEKVNKICQTIGTDPRILI
jgi:hypothetical protein